MYDFLQTKIQTSKKVVWTYLFSEAALVATRDVSHVKFCRSSTYSKRQVIGSFQSSFLKPTEIWSVSTSDDVFDVEPTRWLMWLSSLILK